MGHRSRVASRSDGELPGLPIKKCNQFLSDGELEAKAVPTMILHHFPIKLYTVSISGCKTCPFQYILCHLHELCVRELLGTGVSR